MNVRDDAAGSAAFLGLRPAVDTGAAGVGDLPNFVGTTQALDQRICGLKGDGFIAHDGIVCDNRTIQSSPIRAKIAHTRGKRPDKLRVMYDRWIAKGLEKQGKTRSGLAHAIGRDPSVISKIVGGTRTLKAAEVEKAAAYLEEPPPSRMMPIRYSVGAGQAVTVVDSDDPSSWEPVAGMWGMDVDLAVVKGDSMYPFLRDGAKLFLGMSRAPTPRDHMEMRVVRLADDRLLLKIMKKTSDPKVWTLESPNAPPIDDVVVTAVAEIVRIDPRR